MLSRKVAQEMLTLQIEDVGLGFFLTKEHPGEFGHNGADEGFQALLTMNADTGQGIAIMSNSDNGVMLAREYVRAAAKEYRWKYMPPDPRSGWSGLFLVAKLKGTGAALGKYDEMKQATDEKKRPEEFMLNALGYMFLQEGKVDDALRFFQKNTQEYPESTNAYDSLGEAYVAAGQKALAIETYEKSLALDPNNQNGKDALKKLKGEP